MTEQMMPIPGTSLSYTADKPVIQCAASWKNARLPLRAYPDDAGFDLYAVIDTGIDGHAYGLLNTGVHICLPNHCWALVTTRSSMMRTFGLLGIPGIIDPGYRGELMIGVMNTNAHEVVVHEGQRIGQMIPMTSPAIGWGIEWVVDLPESDRADRGFGSTGA